jgi:hypothetical protein
MQSLKVEHWRHWEEICCYLMKQRALESFGQSVEYTSYGSQGQNQYGIDLVPKHSNLPWVGQCKLRERSFTWKMVLDELNKTDYYPNPITSYALFTTANRHTTVQDQKNRGMYYHQRKDGSQFPVEVVFWDDITNLDFIPRPVLERIFPGAFKITAQTFPAEPSSSEYRKSLKAMKKHVPIWITLRDLSWLDTWDFSLGYVTENDFRPFSELVFEYYRVDHALTYNINEWFHKGDRLDIAACLPAADRFFAALIEFTKAIHAHIISHSLVNGMEVLSLKDIPQSHWPQITSGWKLKASYLATVYREDLLGQPT